MMMISIMDARFLILSQVKIDEWALVDELVILEIPARLDG
jgi:hypothetical protein